MNFLAIAKKTIPPPKNSVEVLYQDGDTKDIIAAIKYGDSLSQGFTEKFAKYLKGKSVLETAKNIFDFVLFNIKYVRDASGVQDIKSPSAVFHSGFADCKSMSLFTGSILKNLKIPFVYRFAAYQPGSTYATHVYIIAKDEQGKDVIIDPVYKRFNEQKPYTYKEDLMTKIRYISGLPDEKEIGRFSFKKLFKSISNEGNKLAAKRNNFLNDQAKKRNNAINHEIAKRKNFLNHELAKANNQRKKDFKKLEDVASKGAKLFLKLDPGQIILRGAVLAVIRVNINNLPRKLLNLLKSEDEMRKKGLSPDEIRRVKKTKDEIFLRWDEIGGDHAILEETIKRGAKMRPIFIFNNSKNDIGHVRNAEIGVLPVAIAAAWAVAQGWIAAISAIVAPIVALVAKIAGAASKIKSGIDTVKQVKERLKGSRSSDQSDDEGSNDRQSSDTNTDDDDQAPAPQSDDSVHVDEPSQDEEDTTDDQSVGFII